MTTIETTGTTSSGRTGRRWWSTLRKPRAMLALGYVALVSLVTAGAGILAPYDPTATDLSHVLAGPSWAHVFGTDSLGRDVLSRLMYGGQPSLVGVAQALAVVLVLGVPAGLVAGFVGRFADRAVTWVTDIMLAVPAIVMLLVVVAIFGTNQTPTMVTMGVLGVPGVARVARGVTLAVKNELYISAARVSGLSDLRLISRHVLPMVAGPVIVQAALFAGVALLVQTGLGYLGLGVQPPAPTWGGMVAEASKVIDKQPWMLVPTGLVIALTILAFGLIGDVLRDAKAERVARNPVGAERSERARRAAPALAVANTDGRGTLLSIRGLTIEITGPSGRNKVVEDLDLDIDVAEAVGLVGESGCGKSVTGRSVLGLLPGGGTITAGSILFNGEELIGLSKKNLESYRGSEIALIAQEPHASLDPSFTVRAQLGELIRRHHGGTRAEIWQRALELLTQVNLPDPVAVAEKYPHELSGGMAQRVVIAMALAGDPKLLIADEPTTALDVTVQAEILDLLLGLRKQTGMAVLLITHDWGVVAQFCDRAYVVYAGQIMETADVASILDQPRHPYTLGLLDCIPHETHRALPLHPIPGIVPGPHEWPTGCRFHPRCLRATSACTEVPIPISSPVEGHEVRCVHQKTFEIRR